MKLKDFTNIRNIVFDLGNVIIDLDMEASVGAVILISVGLSIPTRVSKIHFFTNYRKLVLRQRVQCEIFHLRFSREFSRGTRDAESVIVERACQIALWT